jgi:TRAP-type C4-dicarboxylate transport system permease small subunit
MLATLLRNLALISLGALLVVALLTMLDAALRTFGSIRVFGLHDITEFIFCVVVAACFPISLLRGNHITVRLFSHLFGDAAGHRAEQFGQWLTLLFFVASTWGLALIAQNFASAGRTTSTLDIPLAPWVWATTLAFGLASLVQGLIVIRRLDTEEAEEAEDTV